MFWILSATGFSTFSSFVICAVSVRLSTNESVSWHLEISCSDPCSVQDLCKLADSTFLTGKFARFGALKTLQMKIQLECLHRIGYKSRAGARSALDEEFRAGGEGLLRGGGLPSSSSSSSSSSDSSDGSYSDSSSSSSSSEEPDSSYLRWRPVGEN